jgi:hypothetical protein
LDEQLDIPQPDQAPEQTPDKPSLPPEKRQELHGIVSKMILNKEPEQNIKLVIDHYTKKNLQVAKPEAPLITPDRYVEKSPFPTMEDAAEQTRVAHEKALTEASDNINKNINDSHTAAATLLKNKESQADKDKFANFNAYGSGNYVPEPDKKFNVDPTKEMVDQAIADPNNHPDIVNLKAAELENAGKKDEAAKLKSDAYLITAAKRGGDVHKQIENYALIKDKKIKYDAAKDELIKPIGFGESVHESWKKRNDDMDLFDLADNGTKPELINKLNSLLTKDPDEPTPTPKGIGGSVGEFLGGQGKVSMEVAAAQALNALPVAGSAAAELVSGGLYAHEFGRRAYSNELLKSYAANKKNGLSDNEALDKAQHQAKTAMVTDAATAALMGATTGKAGSKVLKGVVGNAEKLATEGGWYNGVIKTAYKHIGEEAPAAIKNAGLAAGGEVIKNISANQNGENRDLTEGAAGAAANMAALHYTFSSAFAILGKIANSVKPGAKPIEKKLLQGLSKAPIEDAKNIAIEQVKDGLITPQEAEGNIAAIEAHKEIDQQIPKEVVNDEVRLELHSKIEKRNELEEESKTLNPAFKEPVKAKIEKLDEKINEIIKSPEAKEETPAPEPEHTQSYAGVRNIKMKEPVAEESAIAEQEPALGEGGVTGIKKSITEKIRTERGLPQIELPKMGSDIENLTKAKERVDAGVSNPRDIINRIIEDKTGFKNHDESYDVQYYAHQLDRHMEDLSTAVNEAPTPEAKADAIQQRQQLSDELDRFTEGARIAGNTAGKVLNSFAPVIDKTSGQIFRENKDIIKEAYGGELPAHVKVKLDAITKERDEALAAKAKVEKELRRKMEIRGFEKDRKSAEKTIKENSVKKNVRKTRDEFKEERSAIKDSIAGKLRKARSGESGLSVVPLPFAKELIEISPEIYKLIKSYAEEGVQKTEDVINKIYDTLKEHDEFDGLHRADIVNLLAGKYKEENEMNPIQKRISEYKEESRLWTKIAEATKMEEDAPKKKQEKSDKIKGLVGRLNDIKKKNKEVVKAINDIIDPKKEVVKAINDIIDPKKTDLQKEIERIDKKAELLTKKIKEGKLNANTPIRNEYRTNSEWVKASQRVANAEHRIKVEKRKAFESKKNMYQKGLAWVGRGIRLSVLSGYNVLGKLAAAATVGAAGKRIPEQAIGAIYQGIFKGIAEKAPIEGGVNLSSELKFYKEFFNPKKFAHNAWEILKTGSSDLGKRLGSAEYEHIPGLYLPTDLHQIIKDPPKRATFEASFKNGMNWAIKNGLDVQDPLVINSIENAAYKRAQYEIFQEQNWLSKKFTSWKSKLEKQGNTGATGKLLVDFLIPVSTVPTNIARRVVTTSPLGLLRGGKEVLQAYRNGIEKLTPEQAEHVMMQLKQGTLGTALWLIGWYGAKSFGGLYSKFNPDKKRKEGELGHDAMMIDGKMVPKPVQHALPLEIIQFAATARHIYDHSVKQESTPMALYHAGIGSIGGIVEQIPVIETGAHLVGATTNKYEADKLKDDALKRFEPQILRETGVIKKDPPKVKPSKSLR